MKLNLEDLDVASFTTLAEGAAQGAAMAPTLYSYCGACPQRTYDCI